MTTAPPRYLYHAVTDLTPGTDVLLPASSLRDIDPDAYQRAISKYDDTPERRRLALVRIPVIQRAWTEVVFLSPVHPHAIWSAWQEVAGAPRPPMAFWQIPVGAVPEGAVVYDRRSGSVGDSIDPAQVSHLDHEGFRTALQTTAENRAWLASLAAEGLRGAWFNLTPHVLTPGPVPLEEATVISWDEPPVF